MDLLEKNKISTRVQSIDILRGAVMIIMAIDHVRVYSGIPAGGLTMGVFFTRWITHFCAPAFAFFAGTSAFLNFQKSNKIKDLAVFLISRGFILVVLEITFIRFSWMFNLNLENAYTGVLWMLGWCMIILAGFLWIRPATLGIIGVVIILAQQLFSFFPEITPTFSQSAITEIWTFFYPQSASVLGGASKLTGLSALPRVFGIRVFYVLLPWLGVMMAGYGFGIIIIDKSRFANTSYKIGLSAIVIFIVFGTIGILSATGSDDVPFIFNLLGQQKYPPSQLFLLMTLGPLIVLIPWAEKAKGFFIDILKRIGKVPMFFYLLHIPLIHLSSLVVNRVIYGNAHQEWYDTAPFVNVPESDRWSLSTLYFVWIVNVIVLYVACRWYLQLKTNHPEKKWLKFF